MWLPIRSYGKGTGIVIPITQTQLWEWDGNRSYWYEKEICRHRPAKKIRESLASRRRCLRGFLTNFSGVQVSQKQTFLDGQFKLLWPWPPPLYIDIENHLFLSQKKCLWLWQSILMFTNVTFETWPCDLRVNIYSIYIYTYKCMYVCICMCIHVYI